MNLCQTILLVEDDGDDQEFFITALSGITDPPLVLVAANGKEAIDILERSIVLPSMIFMDINMPIMDGIECLRYIMNEPLMKGIPVIVLSSESYYEEKARNLGAVGFIKKQFSISDLRNNIERELYTPRQTEKYYEKKNQNNN
ncbi:response regulator [Pseudochryseolinea flava]|nr:response regulator [Pseudochryseolinea flava]